MSGNRSHEGFTLIELIVVISIIGILAAIAVPALRQAPVRAKEAALRENLFTLRNVIDQYYADHAAYPQSLDDLVSEGYLRTIPIDPMTGQREWEEVEAEMGEDELSANEDFSSPGIWDVHSTSYKTALDGSAYSDW